MNTSNRIPLERLFPELDWQNIKIHIAQKSGNERPIDVFTNSFLDWQDRWNGGFHSNHCWNRDFVFSLIELPAEPGKWLFGGLFRVLEYKKGLYKGRSGVMYKVVHSDELDSLVGRLVVHWEKDARAKGRKPESILSDMAISEILPEQYAGEDFPGYYLINHSYSTLEKIWRDLKADWFAALANCKGVYLISDVESGLRYVGSASGENGIWSRWSNYFNTGGHGGNKLIRKLLSKQDDGVEYARKNFVFSLLEQASSRDSEHHIISRESYWKRVLMTYGKFGLNDNK
ncbi:GIY-YIG nuclease family protein [Kangiella sp.]|uniref:GIY-YIG nuclease family protein n=1 Tax=Kangiella sp. TaxID=1920245 RepID=UPI0019C125EE|nr:GIY-YIG nuclease family protein [Kangiella sp.]MBD3654493.1 GIY-YIG nuclease family protein [Kangiella sp.]